MSKVWMVKCLSNLEDDIGHFNTSSVVSICTSSDLAFEYIKMAVELDKKELAEDGIEYSTAGHPDGWVQSITYCDHGAKIYREYCCEEFHTDTFYDETYGTEEGV